MEISIIKDIRETYNLTRDEFAERLEITLETLNTWEYRTKKIPKRKTQYIKQIFSSFFKGEEVSIIPENYYMMVQFYEMKNLNTDLDLKTKISSGAIAILPDGQKRLVAKEADNGHYLVVRVDGHSMDDNSKRSISDGEEILIRESCMELTHLPIRTKLFVLVTKNGVVLKQLTKNDGEVITCHSFNKGHEDFTINYSEIRQVFTVEKKVRSSIIF